MCIHFFAMVLSSRRRNSAQSEWILAKLFKHKIARVKEFSCLHWFGSAGVPGETAHLCRDWYLSWKLEKDCSGRHSARLKGLGWPSCLERRLLSDPQGHNCGRHVSQLCLHALVRFKRIRFECKLHREHREALIAKKAEFRNSLA